MRLRADSIDKEWFGADAVVCTASGEDGQTSSQLLAVLVFACFASTEHSDTSATKIQSKLL